MCRSTVSVDWQGDLYDCDFNQMLGLRARLSGSARPHLRDLLDHDARRRAHPRGRPLLRLHRRPGQQLRRRAGHRRGRASRLSMPGLSIVVPVLNEAAGIEATLQALAPLRARGAEVIVVDGGSSDGTRTARSAAGRPGAGQPARPRAADERRRRRGTRRRAAVPACRHAPARRGRCAAARRRGARRAVGPLRRAHRRPAAAAAAGGGADEPALAPDRHRHRRPGDVRAPRRCSSASAASPTSR